MLNNPKCDCDLCVDCPFEGYGGQQEYSGLCWDCLKDQHAGKCEDCGYRYGSDLCISKCDPCLVESV